MRRGSAWALVLTVMLVWPAAAEEMIVSAAISMREAVREIGERFTAERRGVTLRYNVASSGDLQKQIEAGAPVDVFISAAPRHMDELERRGFLLAGTRRVVARNVLTVIRPADSRQDLARAVDLAEGRVRRIAMGNPRTVPAGQYTEQSLRALGLWERLQPRIVLGENVRQVLEYVARGEADAGFVYATDVGIARGRAVEAFRPPEDTYGAVLYVAAALRDSHHAGLSAAFVAMLVTPQAQAVLRRLGFQPPPPGVSR